MRFVLGFNSQVLEQPQKKQTLAKHTRHMFSDGLSSSQRLEPLTLRAFKVHLVRLSGLERRRRRPSAWLLSVLHEPEVENG